MTSSSRKNFSKMVVKQTSDTGDFTARLKAEKEAKRRGERIEVIGGGKVSIRVEKARTVTVDAKTGQELTKTDLLIRSNKALLSDRPKGSYIVTKADGAVVYRLSGVDAQGQYIKDVYKRIKQENVIKTGQGSYTVIPASAKKVKTKQGEVFRTFIKSGDKTFITDYKPGGVTTTKEVSKTFVGGSSVFIPKPADKPKDYLPPTPTLDFALKQSPVLAGKPLGDYAEKLIKREKRLSDLKSSVYSKLHIQGKQNAKWYNVFEIAKGVARVPFEIASIPVFLYGRVNLIGKSVFDPAGQRMLKQGVKDTPSAFREVFVHKDTQTGKYSLTAQNVVNIGLTAFMVRRVGKARVKVRERTGEANIKGTIEGYQDTFIFKSSGKFQGKPIREFTVFKGKSSTSTIQYGGKTYIINRPFGKPAQFKIIDYKTKINFPKLNKKTGGTSAQKPFLTKELLVLKKGTFKPGGKPISFKKGQGVTTQDIQFLNQRPVATTYIKYLEQLKTKASANTFFKSGKQNLKFDAKANIKVKADVQGVITNQRVSINRLDYQSGKLHLTREFNKPTIKFSKKPTQQPDVLINRHVLDGSKARVGFEKGAIAQPRHVLRGDQSVITKGVFTIKSGVKPPSIIKPIKTQVYKPVRLSKKSKTIWGKKVQEAIIKETKPLKTFKLLISKTKPAQASINIPFKTEAPPLNFQSINYDLLSAQIGIKTVPLLPSTQIKVSSTKSPPFYKERFLTQQKTRTKIRTFQEVRPATIFKTQNVVAQIQKQGAFTDIKAGQSARQDISQAPKSIIEQVQSQAQVQAQIQAPIQSQAQIQKQAGRFQSVFTNIKLNPFSDFKIVPPPLLPAPFVFPKTDFKGVAPSGFNVLTRIKGVFKQANIKPLSKADAINFGAFRVQNTSQATFKILEANGQAQDVFKIPANLKDFYKKDELFIEKRGRRISSFGELQEITFKGIQANKIKARRKKIK